jgi:hypothetical protein
MKKDTLKKKAAKSSEISVANFKLNQRHVSRNSDLVSIIIKIGKIIFS